MLWPTLGATIRDVSLPHTFRVRDSGLLYRRACRGVFPTSRDSMASRYGARVQAEAVSAMYDATRSQGFGAEVTRRILLGTYVLSAGYYDAYYKRAQDVRTLITADFRRVFADGVDLLFTPTAPTPAFKLGSISDPYEMYLNDIFTATANLSGVPAISVPIGHAGGLPVGGQIIAPHFGEAPMFAAAAALERALGQATPTGAPS